MIGLIGIPTCALGPLLGWVQWKWEIQRQKAGPLWMFAPATGMFSNVRQNAGFHRDRLCAIQFLKFDEEQKFIQINFVVNQPDGQLPKRHVLCTVGDCGWDNSRSLVRDFLREAGGVGVPVLHHQEVCTHDFGYMPVDWIRGKKKRT